MFGPIALCCISIKEKLAPVAEPDVHELFSPFSSISKILIFQREPSLKCFIEFSDTLSFERALRNIDRVPQHLGKVSLYHSKKDSLKNAYEFPPCQSPLGSEKSNIEPHVDFSTTDGNFCESEAESGTGKKRSSKGTFDSRVATSEAFSNSGGPLEPTALKPVSIPEEDIDDFEKMFMRLGDFKDGQASRTVVLIENFTLDPRLTRLLQNAIGCYGNLVRMLANYKRNRFFAEMENSHQANLVHIYLDGFVFFKCSLKVKYTPVAALVPSKWDAPLDFQFFQMEDQTQRFKKHLSIKFNPPSKILHFTSIARSVDHLILYELISQVHEPVRIYKLAKNSNRSEMYLAEFATTTHSIEVLAALHNKIIENKSLKISFSHPEIN